MTKNKWYLDRARSMSPAEILYRIKHRIDIEQERRNLHPGKQGGNLYQIPIEDAYSRFRDERDTIFFFSWKERQNLQKRWKNLFPEELEANQRSASELFSHHFSIFRSRFYLGEKISWERDPRTLKTWPQDYWADIDTRDGRTYGGVKWVWELNRHHHLVTLAKAYFLGGNEKYAREVCDQLVDWIHTNPPQLGINWTSSLELSIRLINWFWALAFIRNSLSLTSDIFSLIASSIYTQGKYISRHTSAYSSANNHLIGEASGLATIGLCFPWFVDAIHWRKNGLEILNSEIVKQIYPDGVPAEQSTQYLSFILDFCLFVWRLAELNNVDVPKVWRDRLAAASEFLLSLMDCEGTVPQIGDSDDGRVFRLNDLNDMNDVRSILASAAMILNRSDMKAQSGGWDEKNHWFFGNEGFERFESLPEDKQCAGSRHFRTGGYSIIRDRAIHLIFDCGPLGYLSTASHGHADALSLLLSVGEDRLLIDPGTYAYQEGGPWREFFRGTRAHNTVVIEGADQSQMNGDFLWGRKANVRQLLWDETPDYFCAVAEHDGYSGIGVKHRRSVWVVKPDWVVVVDELDGRGIHRFEQLWHLDPACRANSQRDFTELSINQKKYFVLPLEMPEHEVRFHYQETDPIQGWMSASYGKIGPATVINFSGKADLPIRLITGFYLSGNNDENNLSEQKTRVINFIKDRSGYSRKGRRVIE